MTIVRVNIIVKYLSMVTFCCVVRFVELFISWIREMAHKRQGKSIEGCSESKKAKMAEKDQQVIFQALCTFKLNFYFELFI